MISQQKNPLEKFLKNKLLQKIKTIIPGFRLLKIPRKLIFSASKLMELLYRKPPSRRSNKSL